MHPFKANKSPPIFFRLRHNVIKAGVRMINLSYSRISLGDIAQKLQLDSAEDAEFIVAKVKVVSDQNLNPINKLPVLLLFFLVLFSVKFNNTYPTEPINL